MPYNKTIAAQSHISTFSSTELYMPEDKAQPAQQKNASLAGLSLCLIKQYHIPPDLQVWRDFSCTFNMP